MKAKLLKLDNQEIIFKVNKNKFSIKRVFIESKFKSIYWFIGNLFEEVLKLQKSNPKWFDKYKITC